MTENHPIIPPPELRRLWAQQAQRLSPHDPVEWMQYVSEKAAQWGADCELDACCEWLANARNHSLTWEEAINYSSTLRASRRPKPPSLKEQALDALDSCSCDEADSWKLIRRALEQLDD